MLVFIYRCLRRCFGSSKTSRSGTVMTVYSWPVVKKQVYNNHIDIVLSRN
jgi:hypothetical protein